MLKNKLVTKEVHRELLISKLLLAIVEKWPWMDNEFKEALQDQEINAGLYTQAANSLDVNLLDLGFF